MNSLSRLLAVSKKIFLGKRFLVIRLVTLVILIVSMAVIIKSNAVKEKPTNDCVNKALINQTEFCLELATSISARSKGLSGRDKLAEDKGMLFIFPSEGYYPFWMKGMKFNIDIIWLNSKKEVVYIQKDAPSQESLGVSALQLPMYIPKHKAKFVLEIQAGLSDKLKITPGTLVDLKL